MPWLILVVLLLVSPVFCEEEHRVEMAVEIEPDRVLWNYRDNMFWLRMTRIPEPDGDIWLTDMLWAAFDPGPELPKFENRIKFGLHAWVKENPAFNQGLAGWTPEQRMYGSLQFNGHIGRAELVAQVCGTLMANQKSAFGIDLDDFQYPIITDHLFFKARASFWHREEFHYSYGLSWHQGPWQAYYLLGDSPTWGLRFTAVLAGTDF